MSELSQGDQSTDLGGRHLECSWAAVSHAGLVRQQNQDAVRVGDLAFVVCDGMGGHSGGETASRLAADQLVNVPAPQQRTASDVLEAFAAAQEAVELRALAEPLLEGMGSTATVVAVCGDAGAPAVVVASVGDTRAYLVDAAGCRQVTVDHTVVAELVAAGTVSATEASLHPERHVLTRAIGGAEPISADCREFLVEGAIRVAVTSDGVHSFIDPARLATLLTIGEPGAVAARVLAEGLAQGAPDNLSCVVVDLHVSGGPSAPDERTVPRPGQTQTPMPGSSGTSEGVG